MDWLTLMGCISVAPQAQVRGGENRVRAGTCQGAEGTAWRKHEMLQGDGGGGRFWTQLQGRFVQRRPPHPLPEKPASAAPPPAPPC